MQLPTAMSGASAPANDTFQGTPKTTEDVQRIQNMLAVGPNTIHVNPTQIQTGHSSDDRGLKYQIEGRATRLEVDIGNSLATYQDPIKAMFSTRICEGQKVQVFRKFVVGGEAVPTPERAPARIVKVQEDMKEVKLIRYGADLTMNLNLMLRPADAQQELQMKVDVQKKSLENELTRFGYEQLMGGTPIGHALARSKGLTETIGGGDFNVFSDRVHESVFAAFQRHENPLTTLISMAKSCTAYRNVIGPNSLMILPHASPEMLEYGKYNKMTYSVNGVASTSKKPLTVAVDDVYDDPTIGLKLMVHHPPHNYNGARGQVAPTRGTSPLFQEVVLFDRIEQGYSCINFKSGAMHDKARNKKTFRKTVLIMGSAVIGVPGENTGELLIGYPFTATSTNQRTESMCVSLRVYLGAILKSEDQVIVLPNVYIDHVKDCELVDESEVDAHNAHLASKDKPEVPKKLATHYKGNVCYSHGDGLLGDLDTVELAYLVSGINLFEKRIKLTKPIVCDKEYQDKIWDERQKAKAGQYRKNIEKLKEWWQTKGTRKTLKGLEDVRTALESEDATLNQNLVKLVNSNSQLVTMIADGKAGQEKVLGFMTAIRKALETNSESSDDDGDGEDLTPPERGAAGGGAQDGKDKAAAGAAAAGDDSKRKKKGP